MAFVFPSKMYHRFKLAHKIVKHYYNVDTEYSQLKNAYEVYKLCNRRYLGFGALLQFIPTTNAFKARRQLNVELEDKLDTLRNNFLREPTRNAPNDIGFGFYRKAMYSELSSYFGFKNMLFIFLTLSALGFKRPGIEYHTTLKVPLIRLLFTVPILKDILFLKENLNVGFHKHPLHNLFLNVLNPAYLALGTLQFLHNVVNRILELGSGSGEKSSRLRFILKSAVGFLFGVVQLPLFIIMTAFDLPLRYVVFPLAGLVVHFAKAVKDAYVNLRDDKKVFVATAQELHDVKELRRAAKGRQDTSYLAITKAVGHSQEYIGVTDKDQLYGEDIDAGRLVAIRGSNKKITATTSLFSIVNFFAGKAKTDETAIAEAKEVLGIG